jgi:hypothetical protein
MDIEVASDNEYEEWDDFDPISEVQKGEVELNCRSCVDGKIRIVEKSTYSATEPAVNLSCNVCSNMARIKRSELVELLRNILINNIPVAGGEGSRVQFYPPF